MEVKKPATYEEQLLKLKERGCIIENEDFAMDILKNVNYYRLSAYFIPFKKDEKSYFEGTTFENVYHIYEFDRNLRSILFSTIEEIEILLRTRISYYFSHKYGALGYLDPNNFNPKHDVDNFDKHCSDMIEQNKSKPFVQHHIKEYDSKFPLWVLVELMSLGELSFFYSDMLSADRKAIARETFDTYENNVVSWLLCLTNLRNCCAHYSRLYYTRFSAQPRTPNGFPQLGKKLYDYILVVKFLYPNEAKWNSGFYAELCKLFEQYDEYIDLECMGFPEDWKSTLKK